jgi:hypothetical protein
MKKEAEEQILHRLAMVYDFLKIWLASYNQRTTQKFASALNLQITAIEYISDREVMMRLDSNCQEYHLCHQCCLKSTSLENELRY